MSIPIRRFAVLLLWISGAIVSSAEPDRGVEFFESRIRPLLDGCLRGLPWREETEGRSAARFTGGVDEGRRLGRGNRSRETGRQPAHLGGALLGQGSADAAEASAGAGGGERPHRVGEARRAGPAHGGSTGGCSGEKGGRDRFREGAQTLGVSAREHAAAARRAGLRMDAQRSRYFHPPPHGKGRRESRAGCRPAHAAPPRDV